MQFGFILLVLVAVLHGSSNVVSASISADATLGRVGVASVGGKGARSLRTSEIGAHGYGTSGDEERAGNAVYEKAFAFIARVFGSGKPAESTTTSGVTKTVASAPTLEALKAEGEAMEKLIRSRPESKMDTAFGISVRNAEKKLNLNQFKYMDERGATPDDVFTFQKLKPEVASAMRSKELVDKLDDVRYGQYVMWFRYFKYYKQAHKKWTSELATPILKKPAAA
ncbi:hypothetical protein PHYSODRAFT_286740 [Phytophthora sojae]|uniref:RxLR effector protein n=2 Tax=Phytophthora sojae TaxID=67593 RepID=G4ZR15_PHYSP|nr:hypothetical protein PHYSODRAFT_286740 [Phytophthora sojae]AEK80656.1 Avh97 [Phytophthora sojae]EGZ14095.1 hypothetical protein PHYSODRAFT_286740 [Phytophthora sojae]|eukprot:XP_009531524.1 hypothetical protein PHYSODRAFT_286740 [Phytophthora sojae]